MTHSKKEAKRLAKLHAKLDKQCAKVERTLARIEAMRHTRCLGRVNPGGTIDWRKAVKGY